MPTKLVVTRPPDFREFRKESILQGIHQRFEEQVGLRPGSIALKTPGPAETYGEANAWANCLAEEILKVAGSELAQAALLLPNTNETIIAMLGALKAHKAYVPLDRNFPKERLRVMLEDADPAVLITDDENLALAEELGGRQVQVLNISRVGRRPDAPNPNLPCDPLDRAYILYTSGSTGRPKGIEFLHRNLLHTTMCLTNELFFAASDRVTWLHSPSFGSSVVDIYCCLTNGGTLCPWDAKTQGFSGMADWLVRERITTFQWIPSAFRQFLRTVPKGVVFNDIRMVIMAGEPLTIREVELFRQYFPKGSHLVNQVGTGESYNYYLYRVDHEIPIEGANVPGGYPVSEERQVLILDDEKRELPAGAVGEIGIKSDYMSAGYWRDAELTRSKFIRIGTDPTPVYLTGDLGRKDFQVKVRGCRVEVAEVEHVLGTVAGVQDSAVWIARSQTGEDQLVGYVVLRNGCEFNQEQVETRLGSRLPDYMVPRHYMVLDSLPSLPTGKVNRRGLPNPFERNHASRLSAAECAHSEEREIIGFFKELLQVEDVGAHADFIQFGGDSLLVAVLMTRVHQRFGVEIRAEAFLEQPTPARLANLVQRARGGASAEPAVGRVNARPVLEANEEPPARIKAEQKSTRTKNLVIISAGKFGREAFSWACQIIEQGAPLRIKGFLDDRPQSLNGYAYETRIIGTVDDYEIEEDDVFVGAIGDPRDKLKYYPRIAQRGGVFVNLIHPKANIGRNVRLGKGIVLGPFASITCDATVGDHVSIGAFSNAAHDTVIGDWCQISSHCGVNGGARLEDGVFLGSHACIIPEVRVGAWAFVGAGSVVVREVKPGLRVFGNPAAAIGKVTNLPAT